MTKVFPINFFTEIFSVSKIFKNRNQYDWKQLIFLFIFINSLLLIPLSLSVVQRGPKIAEDFLSKEINVLNKDADLKEKISQLNFFDYQLENEEEYISETNEYLVGTNLSEKMMGKKPIVLNFKNEYAEFSMIKEKRHQVIRLIYTDDFIEKLKEGKVSDAIVEAVYFQNSGVLIFSNILQIGFILLSMNNVLIIGIALLLYLTKRASNIKSFKESFTIALSLMGGGALLALFLSFLTKDVFVLFGIQSLWIVIMTIYMYVMTRFKRVK